VGAAVAVGHVAIVAILDAAPEDAVAARALAGTHRAGIRAALGLALAGRGTTIVGQGVAIVAGFTGLLLSVATNGWLAGARSTGTVEAGFDLARRGAAIAVVGVAVVAGFEALHDAVAASRRTGLSRHPADVAGLDGLAVAGAAISADSVAVVAGLVGGQDAASAIPDVFAGLSLGGTVPVRFDLADSAAAVTIDGVAVVALLTTLDNTVTTRPAAWVVHARIGASSRTRVEIHDEAATPATPAGPSAAGWAFAPSAPAIAAVDNRGLGTRASGQQCRRDECKGRSSCIAKN